jgi:hypothetical protein
LGALSNAATVAPGPLGTLTVQGSYTQDSLGALNMVLGGVAAAQYSRLSISGAAVLAGSLDVALTNGFTPAIGDVFGVMSAGGGFSGAFSALVGSHQSNGVTLAPEVNGDIFDLVAANALLLSARSDIGNQFSFTYFSTQGLTNIVEYTTSLSPAHWLVLTNFIGDGTLKTFVDPSATNTARFYRLFFP